MQKEVKRREVGTVKSWIKKRAYLVWFGVMIMAFLWGIAEYRSMKEETDLEGWEKNSAVAVASQTYLDGAGNQIVYYCCKTTHYGDDTVNRGGELDRQAISVVIDWEKTENARDCEVGHWPAVLCQKGNRTYLCWTISSEFSCIIEYDANVVAEEDIFRMAESVVQK